MHKAPKRTKAPQAKVAKNTTKKVTKVSKKKIATKAKKVRAISKVATTAATGAALNAISITPLSQSSPVHVSIAGISTVNASALAAEAVASNTTAATASPLATLTASKNAFFAPVVSMNFGNKSVHTRSSRAFTTATRSLKNQHAASHAATLSTIASIEAITGQSTSGAGKKTWQMKNQKGFRKFSADALPPHEVLSMPALSPTMEQGTIAGWVKKIGEKISPGDVICEVTTDKATVAFEATEEGYLAQILIPAGDDIIQVGKPVAIVVEEEDDVVKFKDYKVGGAKKAPTPAAAPAAPAAPAAAPAKAEKDIADQRSCGVYIAPESPQAVKVQTKGGRVAASPLARVTALDLGLDISEVTGTGMFGEVTQANVLAHKPAAKPVAETAVAQAPATKITSPAPTGDFVDQPLTPMRKVIAQRLTQSKQSIPHYYITVEIQMDQVNKLRNEFNKQLAASAGKDEKPIKLSVNDFIIKASAAALNKVPDVNSSWQDTSIRRYNYVDISVAVATDAGLITPIIADADLKGFSAISTEMKSLAGRARQGKLQPHEFQGGTFTISNLGMFGVDSFSAIINPPQAAILAIGGTSQKVVPNTSYDPNVTGSQQFKAVDVMKVTASFDHRVVDGAVGAQFLSELKSYLESPTKLLL